MHLSSKALESTNASILGSAPVPPPPSFLETVGITIGYYYQFGYGVVNGTRFYGGPES
jgi:hypothetical protein